MNRFFVTKENISGRRIRVTDPDDVRHAARVLRIREGERVEVSDGEALEYIAEVESIDADEIGLFVLEERPFRSEPRTRVTLFQGYPKADKLETIVQKTTELGVSEIVPVYTARSVVRDNGKGEKKRERLQKIAASAAEQSKRGIIPRVCDSCAYGAIKGLLGGSKAAPADANTGNAANPAPGAAEFPTGGPFDLILIPYEEEEATTLREALRAFRRARPECFAEDGTVGVPLRVAVLIGPEGGFDPSEVATAKEMGAVPVTLGPTILRTETAGPATLAMLLYELEMC